MAKATNWYHSFPNLPSSKFFFILASITFHLKPLLAILHWLILPRPNNFTTSVAVPLCQISHIRHDLTSCTLKSTPASIDHDERGGIWVKSILKEFCSTTCKRALHTFLYLKPQPPVFYAASHRPGTFAYSWKPKRVLQHCKKRALQGRRISPSKTRHGQRSALEIEPNKTLFIRKWPNRFALQGRRILLYDRLNTC